MFVSQEVLHQGMAAVPVALGEFIVGLGYGWVSPTLTKWQSPDSDFTPTIEECSWIASLHESGRTLGPIISAIALDRIGRKSLINLCLFSFLTSWLLITCFKNVLLIYTMRMLVGIANGVNDVTSSIYLAEISSPNRRGVMGGCISVCFYGGIFVEYILATYLSYDTVGMVNIAICIFTICFAPMLTETPYFLMLKGMYKEAEDNLKWLQGNVDSNDVSRELGKIRQNVQTEKHKKSSLKVTLAAPENYKSILMVLGIYLLATATGYSAINSYASTIFTSSEIFTSNEYTILLGVIQFLAVCISPFIVEKFNRRTLILVAYSTMAVCHLCIIAVYVENSLIPSLFPWLVFMLVTSYSSIYAMIYPALFIIRGELFPLSIKAIGGSVAIVGASFMSFIIAKVFPLIAANFGLIGNFSIYFLVSLMTVIYIYIILPETRGKSLTDIHVTLN